MPDIGLIWDAVNGRGDWARDGVAPYGADDGTGGDLTAAVMVSLFTDRRASPDFTPNDGTDNRRGYFADTYEGDQIGSRLWQLQRSRTTTIGKQQTPVLLAARDYCKEALQWLIDDGWARSVDVQTFWAARTNLGIKVTINLSSGPSATISTSLPLAA